MCTRAAVFAAGTGGYHTHRIPALVVSPEGALLAFCEGRRSSASDHGDIDLLLKRSADGGATWSEQEVVHGEPGDVTIGNPCPVVDRETGTIWLPFCRDNDDVFVTSSTDDGRTWARPRRITSDVKRPEWGWFATGPGVGIQMEHPPHGGRLVVPCDHKVRAGERSSHAFYSDDHGDTWRLGGGIDPGCDECQVVELVDGSLMMNIRMEEHSEGCRAVARSGDGGLTWSPIAHERSLPCPTCQAGFIRGPDAEGKSRLLFSNPASSNERHRLTVRASYDEGATWPVARALHEGPAAYSCLAVLPDSTVGCLYEGGVEHRREGINFARFSLRWLED